MQLDAINDRFSEAREEISIAHDDAETTCVAHGWHAAAVVQCHTLHRGARSHSLTHQCLNS